MKNILTVTMVFALALIACDDKPEEPTVPNPVTITKDNGLNFDGYNVKVTIRSDDKYTDAEWDAIVKKVVAALNAAYAGAPVPATGIITNVFATNNNAQIVLVNNLAYNWEVKNGEYKTLYLKTGSIATANYVSAVQLMSSANAPGNG
jgi:hypothetical protein